MPSNMMTLHEIAVKYANKQPGIIDDLTEDSPILDMIKWKPANGKLDHTAEVLTDVTGPAFVKLDAPLPMMNVSTDLVRVELNKMGGVAEVPSDRAMKLGGPMKYFADKQRSILRKSGMDTERQIVMMNWLRAAVSVGGDNLIRAGGAVPGQGWFILAVRFDPDTNCGLYDPDQFSNGRLFNISFPYNGAEHYLKGNGYEGVLGYSVVYRAHFGYMMLLPARTVAAIVNIDEKHKPTVEMFDNMLAAVRADEGNTYIFCGKHAKTYGINPYKVEKVQLVNGDSAAKTYIDSWNGVRIVTSYNIDDKIENI